MSHDPSEHHFIPNSAVATSAFSSVPCGHPRTGTGNSAPTALKTGLKIQCWETGGCFSELLMKGSKPPEPQQESLLLLPDPSWASQLGTSGAYMLVRIFNSKSWLSLGPMAAGAAGTAQQGQAAGGLVPFTHSTRGSRVSGCESGAYLQPRLTERPAHTRQASHGPRMRSLSSGVPGSKRGSETHRAGPTEKGRVCGPQKPEPK